MSINRNEFYAAKIIGLDNAFYLLEVYDHNQHVGEIAKALGASEAGRAAALCHDLGKISNLHKAISNRKPGTARDYLEAYTDWIVKEVGLDKLLEDKLRQCLVLVLLRKGKRQERFEALKTVLKDCKVQDERLQELIDLSVSPFPFHASSINDDIQGRSLRKDCLSGAGCPSHLIDYAIELIRMHHSFRVDRIIGVVSTLQFSLQDIPGEQFVQDLHILISADNLISGIYEKVLAEAAKAAFSFGDPGKDPFLLHDLEGTVTLEWSLNHGYQRKCKIQLDWQEPNKKPHKLNLDLVYHVVEVEE